MRSTKVQTLSAGIPVEALQREAEASRAEWIAVLGEGVLPADGWAERLSGALERRGAAAGSGLVLDAEGCLGVSTGSGLTWEAIPFQEGLGFPAEDLMDLPARPQLFPYPRAMAFRRDAFLACGGADPYFAPSGAALDLGWRMNLLGYPVAFVPEAVARETRPAAARLTEPRPLFEACRDALQAAVKNLSDESLPRVLASALFLANRRMLDLLPYGRPRFAEPARPAAAPNGGASTRPARRRSRLHPSKLGVAAGRLRQLVEGPPDPQTLRALAEACAADAVLADWETLWARRLWVQARRVKSDAGILPLFREPFRTIPDEPELARLREALLDALGLRREAARAAAGRSAP